MNAYLFDLGNVLAGFEHMRFCQNLSKQAPPWTPDDIHRIVFLEGINDRFETGELSSEDFHQELCSTLGLDISPDRLRELWCDIFWENPGMEILLEALHTKARLILLSNTNPWHLEFSKNRYGFFKHFDRVIVSYEIGARKPDARIFDAALDAAGVPPERCLYFDDTMQHVEAAARLGIPSVLFRFADSL